MITLNFVVKINCEPNCSKRKDMYLWELYYLKWYLKFIPLTEVVSHKQIKEIVNLVLCKQLSA